MASGRAVGKQRCTRIASGPTVPFVIPAQAGIQRPRPHGGVCCRYFAPPVTAHRHFGRRAPPHWIPACAGMTREGREWQSGQEWRGAVRHAPTPLVLSLSKDARLGRMASERRLVTGAPLWSLLGCRAA
ncbi:hypothetical protein AEB_P0908 [Altererythrobacter sp. B11]|nr:hypothetical protein AEB_P0908 [Altererythrobacter sp. B11]